MKSRKEEVGEKFETVLAATMIFVSQEGANRQPSFLASGRPKPLERPAQIKTDLREETGERKSLRAFSSFTGLKR